jgi:hypothetical protein
MIVDEIIRKHRDILPMRKVGINIYRKTKSELIHMIQEKEGNSPCYKGSYSSVCGQRDCCWFNDCKHGR